jgi:adenylate kinase family enzyme
VQRVLVVGTSGSGKSRLSRRLATRLDAPHVELDALRHQAGWVPMPAAEMRARVERLTAGDRWVVDGNYLDVQPVVLARADTVVWIDLPRWLVMTRLARRSLWRGVTRRELWNGNRESLRRLMSPRSRRVRSRSTRGQAMAPRRADPAHPTSRAGLLLRLRRDQELGPAVQQPRREEALVVVGSEPPALVQERVDQRRP